MFTRHDDRAYDQLRSVSFECDVAPAALGSVLIKMGNTHVICAVSVENKVPSWMKKQGVEGGWITGEYSMLPYSTGERNRREIGKLGGRTMEIQRLIGRSLRAAVDLTKLGPRSLYIDCDVLQADGGTRTAAITGGFAALRLAVNRLMAQGELSEDPIIEHISAISVGVVEQTPVLDLCYVEDVAAETDMNVVMTASGKFIELQGTAEEQPYTMEELQAMLALAGKGCAELVTFQNEAVQQAG